MSKVSSHELRERILSEYDILDSEPEPAFDRLTALAARQTASKVAAFGLLDKDREWFKSIHGGPVGLTEYPLETTFCQGLLDESELTVTDALEHPRFSSLAPVVEEPRTRSYAGVAIKAHTGETIGALCLFHDEPREFAEDDLELLRTLANQVEEILEYRRTQKRTPSREKQPTPTYRELHERLAMIYDHSSDPFYMVDEDWCFVYMNSASAEFLGKDREKLIGANLWETFPRAKASTFRHRMNEVAETGENHNFELFYKPLESWFQVKLVYTDPGVAVFYNDVTDRILRIRQLTDDEERFRMLTEASHDAFFEWEPGARRVTWSEGIESLTGYTTDELSSEEFAWQNLVHPLDLDETRAVLQAAIESGDERLSTRLRWIRKDGSTLRISVHSRLIRDRSGIVTRAFGGVMDETDRLEAADRLKMLGALIDQASDAILVYDRAGRIEFWNESAQELYGWTAAEALGERVERLIYPDPAPYFSAQAELVAGGDWQGELTQKDRDGNLLDVKVKWTLVRDVFENHDRILAIHTDITSNKKLEKRLRRVQRLETIGRLAGGIAHDLNNFLAPILVTASAYRGSVGDEDLESDLEMIETCARQGSEMIRQILEFARDSGGTLVPTDIADVIASVERIVRETFPDSIQFEVEVANDLPVISAVPPQIRQVISNLVVNAKDAMPQGGVLKLQCYVVDSGEIYGDDSDEVFIRIRVEDSGAGIREKDLERIFEPFFTTRDAGGGTGLGLATVHRIVTEHRGVVDVESTRGLGTTFTVDLPVDALDDVKEA